MRKFLVFALCFAVFLPPAFAKQAQPSLPDNVYFRAMQDEMNRTLKELRSPGSPAPYYAAYKLRHALTLSIWASLGQMRLSSFGPEENLSGVTILGVGSDKNDQLGFENNRFSYDPFGSRNMPSSYDGIRRDLWNLSNSEYHMSLDSSVKKQAYKRKKELSTTLPDMVPAPQAAVFEEAEKFDLPDTAKWEEIVKTLSAKGKNVSQLDNFEAEFTDNHWEYYYLNSLGGAYQTLFHQVTLTLSARLRNRDGHVQSFYEYIPISDYRTPDEKALEEKTDAFLAEMLERYNAYKAESYLGPVLLRPHAAAQFIESNFVWQVENVKPLLSDLYEQDPHAGSFREKKGMRVLSNVVDIVDKPLLREYKGLPLFYMPVDDEGVPSKELKLTSLGRLRAFPLSRRPLAEGHESNGHARLSSYSYPRESLTNVFVEPKTPLSEEALQEEFLAMCRDWDLKYCYELETYGDSTNRAWRVYAEDGRRVPAYGLDLKNISTRSLRDIAAAGGEDAVYYTGNADRPGTIVTPSLLLEEAEILPVDAKPDRAPFVPKP